ncbi:MAG: hypothetical protein LUG55_03925 [Clostridiales bacterium]|nr:hypothetical protein [Clostridiales bacterium]
MLLSLAFRFIIRFSIIREKAGRVKEFTQKIGTDFRVPWSFQKARSADFVNGNLPGMLTNFFNGYIIKIQKGRCPVAVRPYVTEVTATSCSEGRLLLFDNLNEQIQIPMMTRQN